jgi:glycosyltransferase involved in cell wall biosynthesis
LAVVEQAGLECRVVVEPEVGLTAARLQAIRETTSRLLVFVDDDNLLDSDYLEQALRIAGEYPRIGAFGGRISPEFEVPEPDWLWPFRSHLALIDLDRDFWTNNPADHVGIPCGAGLCIRREAAVAYFETVAADPRRRALDRSAAGTLSCGDTDMVLSCADAGWGMGRFTALHLTHVIPAARLEFAYQKRLAADIGYSYGRLLAIRGEASRGRKLIALAKTGLAFAGIKHRGKSRSLDVAFHHGVWKGLRSLA